MSKKSRIDFDYQDEYLARVYRNGNYLGEYWNQYDPKIFGTKRSTIATTNEGFGLHRDLLELSEMEDTDIIIECDGKRYKASSEKFLDEGTSRFKGDEDEKIYLRAEQLYKLKEGELR